MDSSVTDLTNFDGVESIPFHLMELFVEVYDELGMNKIQKSISNITVILSKDRRTL